MSRRYLNLLFVLTLSCFVMALNPVSEAASPIEIKKVTYAHGLTDEMQPIDPDPEARFAPDETVYLLVTVKGRPKEGIVTARFYWKEDFIAEANVDLADINSGLIFSFGQDTYAGYTLTHQDPFPVSGKYYAVVFFGDEPLGTYAFHVVPPPDAIPSRIDGVTLAKGIDEDYNPIDPTEVFDTEEKVYLVGHGDLGIATWLQAEWYVDGVLDDAGTRNVSMKENQANASFFFSYLPESGWVSGTHSVTLTMNDEEVGAYSFAMEEPFFSRVSFLNSFPLPDDGEVVEVTGNYDGGFATSMIEPEVFDAYAEWLKGQGWQQQAPTEAMVTLPHQVWRTAGAELLLEIQGQDDRGRTVVWFKITKTPPSEPLGHTSEDD